MKQADIKTLKKTLKKQAELYGIKEQEKKGVR